MVARGEDEHQGDDRHAEDVPPGRHVRQEGDHPHSEGVEQAVDDEDAGVDDENPAARVLEAEHHVEKGREEEGEPVVDAGRDGHLAEEVEPAGEPAPRAGVLLGQFGGPVVQAAGGRIGGGDLGHPEADDGREEPDDDPAPDDVDRAAFFHPEVEERQAARQHRDDREGDGEVGEAAHPAVELLGVAKLVELCYVRINATWHRPVCCRHLSPPSTTTARAAIRCEPLKQRCRGKSRARSVVPRTVRGGLRRSRHPAWRTVSWHTDSR